MRLVLQPWSDSALGDILQSALSGVIGDFDRCDVAVAFVKRSGVQYIADLLRAFVERGGGVRFVVGIDQRGSSIEGLSLLLEAIGDRGEIWIVHDSSPYVTFHPKLYLFQGRTKALLVVGSGNLTEGGLYTNDEASAVMSLDLELPTDLEIVEQAEAAFARWCDSESGTARILDAEFVEALVAHDYIRPEAQTTAEGDVAAQDEVGEDDSSSDDRAKRQALFGSGPRRRRPGKLAGRVTMPQTGILEPAQTRLHQAGRLGFVMTLMKTDAGVGQATPGASRRSPEIFVPLQARDAEPEFWGWRDLFVEDPRRPGKWDRRNVAMKLGDDIIHVNMMTWPVKHDFRLRSEALRSAGREGDILRIEQSNESDYDYYVDVISSGTDAHEYYLQRCIHQILGRSTKKWGYYTY